MTEGEWSMTTEQEERGCRVTEAMEVVARALTGGDAERARQQVFGLMFAAHLFAAYPSMLTDVVAFLDAADSDKRTALAVANQRAAMETIAQVADHGWPGQ